MFLGINKINWSPKKQDVVSKKKKILHFQIPQVKFFGSLIFFLELGMSIDQLPTLWCDNTNVGFLSLNSTFMLGQNTSKLICILSKEKVANKQIDVRYVPTEDKIVDIYIYIYICMYVFTKVLSLPKFSYLCSKLSLASAKSIL